MKTILLKIIVPDDASDYVYDKLIDLVYSYFEDVEIDIKERKSTDKEKKAWKKRNDD